MYATLLFVIIFPKRVWVTRCESLCVCTLHTCVPAEVGGYPPVWKTRAAVVNGQCPAAVRQPPLPQSHWATLLGAGTRWNVITIPRLKGHRSEVCLGPWGPHLGEKETRIQTESKTEWTQREPKLSSFTKHSSPLQPWQRQVWGLTATATRY